MKFSPKVKELLRRRGEHSLQVFVMVAWVFPIVVSNFYAKPQNINPFDHLLHSQRASYYGQRLIVQDTIPLDSIPTRQFPNQSPPTDTIPRNDSAQDSTIRPVFRSDSVSTPFLQTSQQFASDSVFADSVSAKPVGDITTTVEYTSRDSIRLNMQTRVVDLYGKSTIDYKPIALEAELISIDWNKNTISAVGKEDTTGIVQGSPIFKNGTETYQTKNIRYNFKTQKAVISGLVTEQGEGIIHGEAVFKNEKNELFIPYTKYTTCNLAHPHFYIAARKVKAIPDDKLVSGPFNLVVNDVPTPLGFLFGMFPEQNKRSSGIIVPTYGEQKLKGFFLENGGYFLDLSEYANLALTGSIYSKGGYGLNARSQYINRYRFQGNFNFSYTKQNLFSEGDAIETVAKDFRLTWSHSPRTKGTGRFSANVNAATSTFNQNNVRENIDEQIKTTLSSSVSYSKSFRGSPFSFGTNARFNQNLQTKKVDLLLPEVSMNVQNIYPFQSKSGGSKNFLDRLTFRYSMNGVNKITNQIASDSIAPFDFNTFPHLLNTAQNGLKHNIPLATSLKLLKHFTLNPSVTYDELWYNSKLDYRYDSLDNVVVTDTIQGFSRAYSYGTSISMNTRIYGTYFFNRETGIQAIRHVMTPSIGYSYRPDFGDPKFDYYQEIQTNAKGDTQRRSRYQGFVYGSPSNRKSSSVSLSLTNTLEMKIKSKKDTTNTSEKIALLRNFGISTSYNFAADSFQLSSLSLRATTNLFNNKKIFNESATLQTTSINLNGSVDPYLYVLDSTRTNANGTETVFQRRLNEFTWNHGKGLGTFTSLVFSLRTGIRANTKKSKEKGDRISGTDIKRLNDLMTSGTLNYHEEMMIQSILDYPDSYVDFNVPWSLNVTFNLNVRKRGFEESDIKRSVQFNGDFSLTPKWKLTYSSGYDFEMKDFTQSRIGIFRDLHCWELNFNWVPFGRFTSYDFTIRAKSSLLQDLKLNRRRTFYDNVF